MKALVKSIIILSASCLAAAAELPIDEDKILFDYKKRFNDIISSSIFATPAELRSNLALRQEILDYVNNKDPHTANNENLWNYYITSKFGTRAEFEAKLKQGYLDEADVKARFMDNLVLLKYFKDSVEPRIREDLHKRGEILDYAEEHNVVYESEALKYKFFNIVEEYGGQKRFEKYLNENYLSIADVFYFAKSDFILPVIQEDLFKTKLAQDPAYLEGIERDIQEYYNNHKETKYHIEDKYYVRAIHLTKEAAKLGEQRTPMTKLIAELNNSNPETLAKASKLTEPISRNSKLYDNVIKNAIIGKAAGYISPIIETKTGLHIFIVDRVEPAYCLSYDEVRDNLYQFIKEARIREIELPVLSQL